MTWNSSSWPRPRYVAGGGDALVFFEVCGQFPEIPTVSRAEYHTQGVPEGVEVGLGDNDFSRWDGPMLELLRQSNPEAAQQIETAPHVVTIRGPVNDPTSLDYLRDTLGIVAALLDAGGAGVVDPQTFQFYAPEQWRETFWSGAFEPTSHAVILLSPQADAKTWLHTRGMRLFGRPDISCHSVKPEEVERLQPVFNGLIRMQAAGFIVPNGQIVQAVGIENRLICWQRGDLDDADFNNFHLELEWDERETEWEKGQP